LFFTVRYGIRELCLLVMKFVVEAGGGGDVSIALVICRTYSKSSSNIKSETPFHSLILAHIIPVVHSSSKQIPSDTPCRHLSPHIQNKGKRSAYHENG